MRARTERRRVEREQAKAARRTERTQAQGVRLGMSVAEAFRAIEAEYEAQRKYAEDHRHEIVDLLRKEDERLATQVLERLSVHCESAEEFDRLGRELLGLPEADG